jgi:hypothetical protein
MLTWAVPKKKTSRKSGGVIVVLYASFFMCRESSVYFYLCFLSSHAVTCDGAVVGLDFICMVQDIDFDILCFADSFSVVA